MKKIDIFDIKLDRLSIIFFYYLRLYPDFRSFTLKDLRTKIPSYQFAKDIDIETRIDAWIVSNAIELERTINNIGETEYKIFKINPTFKDIDIYHEIEEEVSEEIVLKWIKEVKVKVYEKKAAQESAFEGVLSTLAESEKVNELKKRKENFVKWYENNYNLLKYYNVENPLNLAKKVSEASKFKQRIPVSFSHFYYGKLDTEMIFKDACEGRFRELLPIEVLVEKINELEAQKGSKQKVTDKAKKIDDVVSYTILDPSDISDLYSKLNERYISAEKDDFYKIFTQNPTSSFTPARWKSDNASELLYLITQLMDGGLIQEEKRMDYQRLKKCFVKANGDVFDADWKSLKQNLDINLSMDKKKPIDLIIESFL